MFIYRKGTVDDLSSLKQMCVICFDEEPDDVDFMFDEYISTEISYCVESDGTLVASLYLVPCSITTENGIKNGHYLYAAATLPEFRKQGIMKNLINFALDDAKKQGHVFSALLPANNSLYDFYKKFGYKSVFSASHLTLSREELAKFLGENSLYTKNITINENSILFDNISQLRFNICKDYYGTIIWKKDVLSFAVKGAGLSKGKIIYNEYGYFIYIRSTMDEVFVTEFMCKQDDFNSLLRKLYSEVSAKNYKLRLPPWLSYKENIKQFGMLCELKPNTLGNLNMPYLGLTFD